MDPEKQINARWKRQSEGISYEPEIEYDLVFNESVKGFGSRSSSLLDLGTGTGKTIFKNDLFRFYGKIAAIDVEPAMIKLFNENAKGKSNIKSYVMDSMKKLDFPDGNFDVITSRFSPFDESEAFRLLSDGGYLVMLRGIKGDHREIMKLYPEVRGLPNIEEYFESIKERNDKLRKAGFAVQSTNLLKYKWVFSDEEALKYFYEKIFFAPIFDGKADRLRKINRYIKGEIPVTRIICTTIARRLR